MKFENLVFHKFRSDIVAKGCIVRGDQRSMTIFTPEARYELNYIGELENGAGYLLYNFNLDETVEGVFTLEKVMERLFKTDEVFDIFSWYKTDWRVSFKGNTLYNIGQMIDNGEAVQEDIDLALQVCDDMKYLILMSDYIPDEFKKDLTKDVMTVKEEFSKIKL